MGLLVTTYLIAWNVYGSIDAPPSRGFSYIELWMIGMEIPIVLALLEYSFILGMKRSLGGRLKSIGNIDSAIARIDVATMIISMLYFIAFSLSYWSFIQRE